MKSSRRFQRSTVIMVGCRERGSSAISYVIKSRVVTNAKEALHGVRYARTQ